MTIAAKAVIFDFDMTLADSSYAIHRCSNLLARRFGLREITREETLAGIGLPLEECWRQYWGDFRDEWTDYYRTEFRALEQAEIRLFPNTLSVLESLREAGIRTGVVSNRRFARRVVDMMKLTHYMDVVVGLEDVTKAKPDPEALFKAIGALRVDAAESVYVGDTDIDMKTSVAAGTRGVGMTTGHFGEEGLTAAGAWRVCSDLIELPGLLGVK